MRQRNPPSILPQQLFVLSLDLQFPNNSLVFEAAELIEAMEKERDELRQESDAFRSAIAQIDGTLEILRELGATK